MSEVSRDAPSLRESPAGRPDKPLKAYHVNDHGEGYGGIVFAKLHAEARRIGAGIYGDGDWDSVECRRSPMFDHLAPGPVPNHVLWESGWWFECAHCDGIARDDSGGVEINRSFYCENDNPAILIGRALAAAVATLLEGNRKDGPSQQDGAES